MKVALFLVAVTAVTACASAGTYAEGVFDLTRVAGVHCAPDDVPRDLVNDMAYAFPPPPGVSRAEWLGKLFARAWPCTEPPPPPQCPGWDCGKRTHPVRFGSS